jgi:phosphoglycerol transferase
MRLRANLERHGRRLMPYVILAIAATLMIIALRMPLSRLDVPYVFTGDAVDKLTQIENVAETGWLFHNDRLGFPFGYDRLDFPRFDSLNYALMGPVAALIGPARAMNLYFLACFYLIAFAAFWSLRRLGLALGPALLCSLIYAFLPYRIVRNVGHLTNAAYYLVPLAIVVLVWLARDRFATQPRNVRGAFIFALAIAVLVPLQMPYNGVYFAYLAVIACAIAIAGGARVRAIAMTAALLAATGLSFVAEQIPAMLHARDAGQASLVADRDPAEAELYSMRLNQVLIPTIFDRRPAAASAKEAFDDAMAVPVTEARDQYIGVLGVIGFIALMWALCRAVAWPEPARTLDDDIDAETAARIAALFALAILVLAISTGLGTLISYWITAKIRTYNRVLPFFAFACLVGGGWALQTALARVRAPWLRAAALVVVAVLAL